MSVSFCRLSTLLIDVGCMLLFFLTVRGLRTTFRWQRVLSALHAWNGCVGQSKAALWGNLNEAWEAFRAVNREVDRTVGFSAAGEHCAACSSACTVSADACAKLCQLQCAASAQKFRVARVDGAPTPWVPKAVVEADQDRRKQTKGRDNDDGILSGTPGCTDVRVFRADRAPPPGGGQRSQVYRIQGLVALVCRHQQACLTVAVLHAFQFFLENSQPSFFSSCNQVLRLCWMYSPENFTYYDTLLANLLRERYPSKSIPRFVPITPRGGIKVCCFSLRIGRLPMRCSVPNPSLRSHLQFEGLDNQYGRKRGRQITSGLPVRRGVPLQSALAEARLLPCVLFVVMLFPIFLL